MSGIFDEFQKMMEKLQGINDETVEKTWAQCGKLSPEDEGKRKMFEAKSNERKRECQMYEKKVFAIRAQQAADADEWWHHLHKTHGLPEGSYHIHEDGRIFIQPKEKS